MTLILYALSLTLFLSKLDVLLHSELAFGLFAYVLYVQYM
jgi:hypothetical protein